jgi:DNA helicase-2/ATP-dependent DNA helicase PcrA
MSEPVVEPVRVDGAVSIEGAVSGLGRGPAEIAQRIDPDRNLTAEQAAVVGASLEPALIVAGAGSGKTETLSLRILYLLDNAQALFGRDISPDEILCLTFTRKAAAEIAERANKRIATMYGTDPTRPEVTVSTYNGYAASLVADHGLRVAIDPDSTILTDAALWQLAASVVEQWDAAVETDSAVSTVTAAIPRLAGQMRDHRVTPAALREWAESALASMEALPKKASDNVPGTFTGDLASATSKLRTLAALADLVEEFDARKAQGSFLDFADQVEIAVRLAHLPHVRDVEAAKYRAVLLDEFQDTSPPQLELFAQLFGDGHPVMAVGDPNQAIYGFRGASADALERYRVMFGSVTPVRTHNLSVSWRNESSILAAANETVRSLAGGPVAGVPLRSRAQELGVPEPRRASAGVVAQRHVTRDDEAAAIAEFLLARRTELGHRPGSPVTAAVLCRRRSQYSAVADALTLAGIDYEIVGLGGLIDVPEVADLLALLEVAHDPSRGDSLMRLLAGERVALGARDLAALHDWAEVIAGPRATREGSASIVDALAQLPAPEWESVHGRSLTPTARQRLEGLAHVVDSIRRHTYLPLAELIAFAERAWGLDIEAAVARPDGRARRSVDAFIDSARTFAAGADHATLGALLAWLDAARKEENGLDAPVREPDPAAVQLLTVHGAKGLEWDVVVVPGLNDGHFPSVTPPSRSSPTYRDSGWLSGVGRLPHELRLDAARLPIWDFDDAADHKDLAASLAAFKEAGGQYTLAEERRLFYVALTRARAHVLLTGSWFTGGSTSYQPSTYLTELIDAGVVAPDQWADLPADGPPEDMGRPPGVWPRPVTPAQAARRALAAKVYQAGPDFTHVTGEQATPLVKHLAAMIEERASRAQARVELPSHLSTSALVAIQRDRAAFEAQLRRPMPTEPTFAAHRGSALHAWIERQYGHTTLLDDDDFVQGILGPDETEGADLAALKATFEASEWATRTPIAIEVDVELPVGATTIRSRIDAVFPPGNGLDKITVVDWKSGSPPRDAAERTAREVQLAVYRLAWALWKGIPLEDVDAAFYYVATDSTVRPSTLLDREQILALLAG